MIHSAIVTNYKYPLLQQEAYTVPGYYKAILDSIAERFEYMQKHSKVLFVRLDFRFPGKLNASNNNTCFQHFMESYMSYLKIQSKLKDRSKRRYLDPHYIWCREHSTKTHNHHYHLLLLFSGNAISYFNSLYTCEKYWAQSLYKFYGYQDRVQGLVHFCKNKIQQDNGTMIYRDNQSSFDSAFTLSSYIAKVYSKENTPFNVNIFSASRLSQLKQEV